MSGMPQEGRSAAPTQMTASARSRETLKPVPGSAICD